MEEEIELEKIRKAKIEQQKKDNKTVHIIALILGAILVVPIIAVIIAFAYSESVGHASESVAFSNQMQQDPSTWNKEQKDRYNGFMDWSAKQ